MLRDADIQAMIAQWRETFYRLAHPTKLGSTMHLIELLNEAAPTMHPLWRSCRWPRNGYDYIVDGGTLQDALDA